MLCLFLDDCQLQLQDNNFQDVTRCFVHKCVNEKSLHALHTGWPDNSLDFRLAGLTQSGDSHFDYVAIAFFLFNANWHELSIGTEP